MLGLSALPFASLTQAQERPPAEAQPFKLAQSGGGYYRYDRQPPPDTYGGREAEAERYNNAPQGQSREDAYRAPRDDRAPSYESPRYEPRDDGRYANQSGPGQPYSAPQGYGQPYDRGGGDYGRGDPRDYPPPRSRYDDSTYSPDEIRDAGHSFFGSVSRGLASVIEYVFQKQGRPNGYILGEDVGGAFVAGLRYGEGWLHTRDAGRHKVFWQGPSIGYDAGAAGSKVMVLVYNLRDPADIYHRFGGVDGSAYVVGGVGVNFQTYGPIVLAPIRSGIGLRFGANIGYLKYTRSPTWNPF
jgi:hypothetical protein